MVSKFLYRYRESIDKRTTCYAVKFNQAVMYIVTDPRQEPVNTPIDIISLSLSLGAWLDSSKNQTN